MGSSRKIGHAEGRRKVTERQQPRRSKRPASEHRDRYADLPLTARLAALVEHFTSEERADGDR